MMRLFLASILALSIAACQDERAPESGTRRSTTSASLTIPDAGASPDAKPTSPDTLAPTLDTGTASDARIALSDAIPALASDTGIPDTRIAPDAVVVLSVDALPASRPVCVGDAIRGYTHATTPDDACDAWVWFAGQCPTIFAARLPIVIGDADTQSILGRDILSTRDPKLCAQAWCVAMGFSEITIQCGIPRP